MTTDWTANSAIDSVQRICAAFTANLPGVIAVLDRGMNMTLFTSVRRRRRFVAAQNLGWGLCESSQVSAAKHVLGYSTHVPDRRVGFP